MSTSSSMPTPGSISWTEIPVQDINRAMKFYKDVFEWEFTIPPAICPETGEKMDEPNLVMFQRGQCHGSFKKLPKVDHLSPGTHPDNKEKQKFSVIVTITVDNTEESVKAVEKAGGSVYIPTSQIPGENMGVLTYFLDSEMNVMGMWSMH